MNLLNPDSKINMPLLNIGLPTVYFYILLPLLLFTFHFDLLFNLYHHAKKRRVWKKRHQGDELLFPFMFNYLDETAKKDFYYSFLLIVTWLTVYLVPLSLLVFIQTRFLPYHSYWITGLHKAVFIADVVLLLAFWKKVREPNWKFNIRSLGTYKHYSFDIFILLPFFFFSFFIAVIPDTNDETILFTDKAISDVIVRNIYLLEATLVAAPPGDEIIAAYIAKSNTEEERRKARSRAFIDFGKGIDLRGRDLRFAFLVGTNLHKADLMGTELQGANLVRANLQGANLAMAELQGANMIIANLQGTDLVWANLQGANLSGAELQGAYLKEAKLQGASLVGAGLQGANLEETNLQGANLSGAELQGAYLFLANLQGANLAGADLQGADLYLAKLQGANFKTAKTEGTLAYEIVPEDKDKIDWVEISNNIKKLPVARLSPRNNNIEPAMKRYENPPDLPFKEPTEKDANDFIQKRRELICENEYIDEGILRQTKGNKSKGRLIRMKDNKRTGRLKQAEDDESYVWESLIKNSAYL